MKIRTSVICRKDRISKDHTAPVFIRFTHMRETKYVSTGVNVDPGDWDFDKQRIKEGVSEGSKLQYLIDTKLFEYDKKIRRLDALDIEITLDNLLEKNNRKAVCILSDCFHREINRLESLGKYASASKVKVLHSYICQFRTANMRLDEIDLAYLNDFEVFLRKQGNKDNSIATKFAVFKAIYNKALAEELFTPKSNPFVKFKVGRLWTPTRKRAISKEELQKLIDIELPESTSPYLSLARDIFLFTYFTAGINIGDIARLKHENIRAGRVYYTRHKTGKEISCGLMPIASEIIAKYSSPFYDNDDYIFPIFDNKVHITDLQKYNRIHIHPEKQTDQQNIAKSSCICFRTLLTINI